MSSLTQYFSNKEYKPKYFIGDRVAGKWNKIPFVGSVCYESGMAEDAPRIVLHLDLPIKYKNKVHTIIVVNHKDITPLE